MNKLKQIITISKNLGSTPVIACIGSTKDIADSLGPITGQLLVEKYKTNAIVVGTLLSPLHALNLEESLGKIKTKYPTLKVFAKELGIDVSTLSQKLNDAAAWKQTEIETIIRMLDIPVYEIGEYFFYN